MYRFEKSGRPSIRLMLSYLLDWIIILATAGVGGALNSIEPYKRPFYLLDPDIAFPFAPSTVSVTTLVLVSLVGPGVLILLLTILLIPGPGIGDRLTRAQSWRRKLWEWNVGWMGLGLSLASAFFITQAMKNLFGVARPHMLAVCQPDLSDLAAHAVGALSQELSPQSTLVSASICQTTDTAQLKDSFRSFPSGHSSMSWSGLLYLTLWFCAKFGVRIPALPSPFGVSTPTRYTSEATLPLHTQDSESAVPLHRPHDIEYTTAAPPTYLLILAFVPVAAAVYICSTRYADFYHHGFDIIFGSLIGIGTSILAFRYYQMPLSHHSVAGWARGPRSKDRAFGIHVGTEGYVGKEDWSRTAVGRNRGRGKDLANGKEDVEMQSNTRLGRSGSVGSAGRAPLVDAYESHQGNLADDPSG